jgi:hypothetical protein
MLVGQDAEHSPGETKLLSAEHQRQDAIEVTYEGDTDKDTCSWRVPSVSNV